MGTDLASTLDANKYLIVEKHLKQAISNRVYQPDDKLPSIRQLSTELKVSKNTVIRAYQELEAQSMVYSVPKSGYRVKPTERHEAKIAKPTRVDLLSVCKQILTYPEYQELLPTGSAHPNIDAPAIKSLYAEIGRQSRQQSHISSHYQLPPGDDLLVKQLAKITQDLGTPANVDDLLVTHGAQQAISLALRATTQTGDIVAVESPCYFGNLLMLESLGLQVVEIPSCPRDGMDPDALEKAMATWEIKVIIVTPNFTNPTGSMMPLERREQLLKVSGDIPIIEDDVFGALSYDQPLPSLRKLDEKQRVIYVNSLSKTLDSRLRIGWMLAGRYRAQVEQYLLCENMGSLNLMQSAVGTFLTSGKYRTHTARMCRVYQANVRRYLQMLNQCLDAHFELKNRYQINAVQGSFLLWLRLPPKTDSYALYQACNEHKISILPGSVFGTQGQYQNCIRLSVANFGAEKNWLPAMETLATLIAQHAK
ncbi:PLP-dependent aminotransferase family protein [Vibrio rotiferianus]|uniref:aminotransferase-like domain-containing protein n=1 Tax=Vibrio rotiferianus TaxID=190895 RepID=UPI0014868AAF|nr:PLP-dependent aminotransferase family protein [Vibrio rotiferianus]